MTVSLSSASRIAVVVVVVASAVALFSNRDLLSPDRIREVVDQAPIAAPVVFMLVYVAFTVLFVPGSVLSLLAGPLFGPLLGTVVTLIGATVGACLAFILARFLGRDRIARVTGGRAEAIDSWIGGRGLGPVLFVRLVPLFPFNAVNYGAGLTQLSLRTFAVGTLVGIAPGTAAYVAFGTSLQDLGSPTFFVSLAVLVVLSVAGLAALRVGGRQSRGPKPRDRVRHATPGKDARLSQDATATSPP